jgi:predicted O-methyltransferase YrrM
MLYFQFLANVMHAGMHEFIVPFPNTSAIAARWLLKHEIQADLVYIDASHDEADVYNDMVDYWKTLRPGGVMFGDDWSPYWPGVVNAATRFSSERGLALHTEDVNWLLIKPA